MTTKNLLHITLGAHGLLCYGYTVKDCPLPEALFQDHDSELKAKTIIPVNLLAGLTLLPSPTSVVAPASVQFPVTTPDSVWESNRSGAYYEAAMRL